MNTTPSHEEYLESNLIGNILANPKVYPEAAEIIRPTDFSIDSAFKIWMAIVKNWSARDNAALQGKVYLELTTEPDKQWFHNSTDLIPLPSTVKNTARQISSCAKRRRIATNLTALSAKAKDNSQNPEFVLEDLIALCRKEMGSVDIDASIVSVLDRFQKKQQVNRDKGTLGLKTGFEMLTNDFVVYQPGHLWVIGAWTSVGKSAFMIEAVNRFFVENERGKVAVFSTEMTEEQNVARMLANRTGVNANVILSGQMLSNHENNVAAQMSWLAGKELHIHTKTRNIDEIASQCRKLKLSGGVDLVWIDFIQNVYRQGVTEQYAMMSQIAKDLQALAHDLGCTIICLSQLPNHAGREDTGILEFKGAGEIAAACDVGVLMKRAKEDKAQILFDVRKNRHGKCGKYLLQFDQGWTRIIEKEVVNQ